VEEKKTQTKKYNKQGMMREEDNLTVLRENFAKGRMKGGRATGSRPVALRAGADKKRRLSRGGGGNGAEAARPDGQGVNRKRKNVGASERKGRARINRRVSWKARGRRDVDRKT